MVEKFECYVEDILYHSPNTQFGIYKVCTKDNISGANQRTNVKKEEIDTDDKAFDTEAQETISYTTIKGNLGLLHIGTQHIVSGVSNFDPKYHSYTYDINYIQSIKPNTQESSMTFLKSIISPSRAKMCLDAYPNFVRLIIDGKEDEIDLSKIKGVKEKTFENIKNRVKNAFEAMELINFLAPYNITLKMINKISELSSDPKSIIKQIKSDPYVLTKIKGIGFIKADGIALSINPSLKASKVRALAYMKHVLQEAANNEGHTKILQSKMISECNSFMYENRQFIIEIIREQDRAFHFQTINGKTYIGLKKFYTQESRIAKKLLDIRDFPNNTEKKDSVYYYDKLQKIEKQQGFVFTDEQREGVISVLSSNVSLIVGYAGTGKSSLTNAVLNILKEEGKTIAQCCLSGRAALRLNEVNGFPSYTIHRLLSLKDEDTELMEDSFLDQDVILVDEASMIGLNLFYMLLMAVKPSTKIIIIGDTGQLDAIGVGCVFKDIIDSKKFNLIHLTKVHRQAQKSAILMDSISIRNNQHIKDVDFTGVEVRGVNKDFILNVYENKDDTLTYIVKQFENVIQKYPIEDIQIIVPMKLTGSASVYSTNNAIQKIYNPRNKEKKGVDLSIDKKPFVVQVGDRVRNTLNLYEVTEMDENMNLKSDSTAVFNGNIGTVIDFLTIDKEKCMIVNFDGIGIVAIPASHYKKHILLGYAITCHAFQGSQNKVIIIGMDTSSYIMLSSGWLYTAITRAVSKCFLNCTPRALHHATKTNKIILKQTFLPTLFDKLDN